MSILEGQTVRKLAIATAFCLLAACGGKEPPAELPPPPVIEPEPEPEPIPTRPVPPGGAADSMIIPPLGVDGVRATVNARLDPLEAAWNFRSGLNVAALNCLDAQYQPILENYKALLGKHGKRLNKINSDLDRRYRNEHGARNATRTREAYMTQVYNYFALPPARSYFCDAALEVSQEALLAPPQDYDAYAVAGLTRLEGAFERFYKDLEHYRIAVAAWDAKYLPILHPGIYPAQSVMTDGGYAAAPGAVYTSATYGPSIQSEQSGTGQATVSQPVVQPVP